MAEEHGARVTVIHGKTAAEIEEQLRGRWRGFDLVAFQVFITNWEACRSLIRTIRRVHPQCRILLGGVHASNFPDACLRESDVDWVVRGEGDLVVRDVVRALMAGRDPSDLPGLAFLRAGQLIVNGPGAIPHDLDELPLPAWHLVYGENGRTRIGHMLTFRGCPFHCASCPALVFGQSPVREHSPERLGRELDLLIERFRVCHIVFYDETFTLNRERVLRVCELLRTRSRRVSWSCFTRPQFVDTELLGEMAAAGCKEVFFGVGSGSDRLLEILDTDVDLSQVRNAVAWTQQQGIQATVSFSLGIPTETAVESWRTVRYAWSLHADRTLFQFCYPFPGSKLYEIAIEHGDFLTGDWSAAEDFGTMIYLPHGRLRGELRLLRKIAQLSGRLARPPGRRQPPESCSGAVVSTSHADRR
jgi:radical SAM superfamily enzyme YgiQ (UPF0313 family)